MNDEGLTQWLGQHVTETAPMAVWTLTGDGDAVAVSGCEEDDDFEIGSISKPVTAMLYADAIARGEVRPDQRLDEWLGLGGAPAGRVTLASLSTHTSGLPRLPKGLAVSGSLELMLRGRNPYTATLPELLAQAAATPVGKPKPAYSNLGYQLLGHAISVAAGTTYPQLVRTRFAEPLHLDPFHVPSSPGDLRPGSIAGVSRRGAPRDPWADAVLGPAGGHPRLDPGDEPVRASHTGRERAGDGGPRSGGEVRWRRPDRSGLADRRRTRPGSDLAQRWHRGLSVPDRARSPRGHRGGPAAGPLGLGGRDRLQDAPATVLNPGRGGSDSVKPPTSGRMSG